MPSKLNFAPLCEAAKTTHSALGPGDCSWLDGGRLWQVLVDNETGAAFTIQTDVIWDDALLECREAWGQS